MKIIKTARNNADYNWEDFDCAAYVGNNYETLLDPDKAILGRLMDFYQDLPPGGSVLEIGAGPNLYPILAASKAAGEIHVTDYPRISYLKNRRLDCLMQT